MSVTQKNLSHCPRCDTALNPEALQCDNCEYHEIEDIDFLDITEQREYKEHLQFQRAAWIEFDKALRKKLREAGDGWSRQEKWKQIWEYIAPMVQAIGFDQRGANKRAELVSDETAQTEGASDGSSQDASDRDDCEPLISHLDAVRKWVAGLRDGEVDSVLWRRFLQSFADPVDDSFLENFRDTEISRQFAQFETARVDAQGRLQRRGQKRVKRFVENLGDGCDLVMVLIPEGGFQMGSDRYKWERPVHSVNVRSFYMGQFPVTQAQWRAVTRLPKVAIELEDHCSAFAGDNLPVDSVSWVEAAEFCARLAKQTSKPYRLPSEAEWEYACRAGNGEEFSFGPGITSVIVNYDATHVLGAAAAGVFRKETVPIGSLGAANDFGLYDMHGNLCEWCEDEWHDNYEAAPANGSAWITGEGPGLRVTRGGSWAHSAEICRSSDRSRESSDLNTKLHYMGFRVTANL
ncbi:MAG TPA: formylglycine-generating enzyme family protein [Pyrinomonadaceae bacterium]|nr:formylglycine-generating enzyme family protein [Pyrinomonadaceae bacterium]